MPLKMKDVQLLSLLRVHLLTSVHTLQGESLAEFRKLIAEIVHLLEFKE